MRHVIPCLALAAYQIAGAHAASAQSSTRPAYHNAFPTVSPDGRHVFFARDSGGQPLTHVMSADGSNAQPLPGGFMPSSWFPDSKRLLVGIRGETRRDPVRLASVNMDGTDLKEIPTGTASIMGGVLLLGDGKTVLFFAQRRDSAGRPVPEIGLMDIDGSHLRRLAMPSVPGRVIPPIAASADGRRLAFTIADTSDHTSYARSTTLYVTNIDGTNVREIATLPDLIEQPAWSPDGRQIVAVQAGRTPPVGTPMPAGHVPNGNLVVFDLETGSIHPIAHRGRQYLDEVPCWSSNGYIYFQSDRDGSMEIFRMKPDGSAQERITALPRRN